MAQLALNPAAEQGSLKSTLYSVRLNDMSSKMSLPGLNVAAPVQEAVVSSVVELEETTEWRFEVAFGTKVDVKVPCIST